MRIAFLNPPWTVEGHPELWGVRAGSRWPHLQRRARERRLPRYIPFPFMLATAAAVTRDGGCETLLIDGVAEDITLDEMVRRITDFRPVIIFLETSTPSLDYDLGVAQMLRDVRPRPTIIMGGLHAADLMAAAMRKSGLPDGWIAGEYDLAVAAIARAVVGKARLADVPGLMMASGKVSNPPAKVEDVDALPSPLFEQLPIANYSDPVCGLPTPVGHTWTSRGCPYDCSFCVWPQIIFGDRRFRPRRLDLALDEAEKLIANHGCESFYFDDDTTNIGERRMRELAEGIVKRGLQRYPWAMMARADCMTDGMLDALAGAGMYAVKYGVESVSPKLQEACGKKLDLGRITQAIEKTKALGVKIHLTFTLGIPGETEESIDKTLDYAIAAAPESAQFSICTPFPGTRLHEECERNGWLTTHEWSRYIGSAEAVIETPWLSAAALRDGTVRAESRWKAFIDARLEGRKSALIDKLAAALTSGARKWILLGEKEFAGFIWRAENPLISLAFSEGECRLDDESLVIVIVSRHDEEKIYRRLLRQEKPRARIIRLFTTAIG